MAHGRFTPPVPKLGPNWDANMARSVEEFLRSLFYSVNGMQGLSGGNPTTIQAGSEASPGVLNPFASIDHTHATETAAPSVKVALSGDSDEGMSSSLLRSDARLVLEDGTSDGDSLVWNGSEWVSESPETAVQAASERLSEILIELRTISHILKQGLSVNDDPERIRKEFGSASNSVLRELRTIAYLLNLGLNVQDQPNG